MVVGRRLLGRRWLYRGSWVAEDTADAGHLPVNHGIVPSARSHGSRMAWARPQPGKRVFPSWPADLDFEETAGRSRVQVAPAAPRTVVDRPGLLPARAAVFRRRRRSPTTIPSGVKESHGGRRCGDEAQHLVECSGDARLLSQIVRLVGRIRNDERGACASLREGAPARPWPIPSLLAPASPRRASRVRCVGLRPALDPASYVN